MYTCTPSILLDAKSLLTQWLFLIGCKNVDNSVMRLNLIYLFYHFLNRILSYFVGVSDLCNCWMDCENKVFMFKCSFLFRSTVLLPFVPYPAIERVSHNHYSEEGKTLISACSVDEGLALGPAVLAGVGTFCACRIRLFLFVVCTRFGVIVIIENFVAILFSVKICSALPRLQPSFGLGPWPSQQQHSISEHCRICPWRIHGCTSSHRQGSDHDHCLANWPRFSPFTRCADFSLGYHWCKHAQAFLPRMVASSQFLLNAERTDLSGLWPSYVGFI